jgi:hypothetical protein
MRLFIVTAVRPQIRHFIYSSLHPVPYDCVSKSAFLEDYRVLGCDALYSGRCLLMVWRNVLPSSSQGKRAEMERESVFLHHSYTLPNLLRC